jgi:hypothetical protein
LRPTPVINGGYRRPFHADIYGLGVDGRLALLLIF